MLSSSDAESYFTHPSTGRALGVLALVLVMFASTGCTALIGRSYSDSEKIDMTPVKKEGYTVGPHGVMQALPTSDETPSIILEVNHHKRTFERVPLVPGQPMFVADLMRDADLYRKVGRVKVTILRPNGNNPPVRMDVDFDAKGKRVEEGMNYSLRAGDHIVVTANDKNFMDRFLKGTVFGKTSN